MSRSARRGSASMDRMPEWQTEQGREGNRANASREFSKWSLAPNRADKDVLDRPVGLALASRRVGIDPPNLVDHVHPFDDLAEHRVAHLILGVGTVEAGVVPDVDVELCPGAVRIGGPRHGNRAALV